jgi:hypothetical protein
VPHNIGWFAAGVCAKFLAELAIVSLYAVWVIPRFHLV